jgi:hypothetical protein
VKQVIQNVLVALALVMVAYCAHVPRSYDDSQAMEQERLSYVQNHPEEKYNVHIMKGEVVKGMDTDAVIASWGRPAARRHVKNSEYREWIYASQDSLSRNWTIFNLAFKDNVLTDWIITKDIALAGGVEADLDKIPVFNPSDYDRTNVDLEPIKKGEQYRE